MRVFVYFQCFFVMPEGRNVIGNLKFWLGDRIGIRDRVLILLEIIDLTLPGLNIISDHPFVVGYDAMF